MAKLYAGLDVSDATTAVCVIDASGATVFETTTETTPVAIAASLAPFRRLLAHVGFETGAKAAWLHKGLVKKRLPAVCVDARALHRALVTQRNKTDRSDAASIAKVMRAGWFAPLHMKSDDCLRLRFLLTQRRALKRKTISLENTLRMSMKVFGATLKKEKAGSWRVCPAARRAGGDLEELAGPLIRAIGALRREVAELDEKLRKTAKNDSICRRLMTAPGVGPLTALTFKSAIDAPERFPNSRTVGAHLGLTPRRFQSGQLDINSRISKNGDAHARTALYEAAFVLITVSKSQCPLRIWALRMRDKKGLKRATVACARKLACILHRMWITGREFDNQIAPRK